MSRLPARQEHITLTNLVDDVPSTGQTETSHSDRFVDDVPSTGQTETSLSDRPCWWGPVYRPDRNILLWQTLLMMSRLPARQEHLTLTNLVDDVPSTGQTGTSYSDKPCWWCPVYRPDRNILLLQTLLMMSRLPARQEHLTLTNLVDDVPSTGQTGTSYSYKPCWWCPVYRPDRNILLWQTLLMMSRQPARQKHLTLKDLVDDVPSTGQTETSSSYKPCWWCPVYRPDRNILLWQTLLMMSRLPARQEHLPLTNLVDDARLPARQKHLTLTNLVDDVPSTGQTGTSYSYKPCWWCPVYRPDRNILLLQTLLMMSRLPARQEHLTLTNLVDDVSSTGQTGTSYSYKPCRWCLVYRPDRNILLLQTLLMMSRLPARQKHLTLTNLVDDVPSTGQTEKSHSDKPYWWCPVYRPDRNISLWQTLLMMSRLPARQKHLTLTNLVDDVPSTGQAGTSYSYKPCWWCPVYQPGRNILLWQTLLMMSRLPARQENLTLTNLVDDVPSTGQTGTSHSYKPCWWCPVYRPGRNILLLQTLLMMSRLPARQEHLTLTNLVDDVPSTGQTETSYSYKPCWWCPVYRPDRNILLWQTLLMMSRLPARQEHLTLTNLVDDVPSTGQTETSYSYKPCWWCPVYRPDRNILLLQTLLMMSRLPARQKHLTLTNLVDDVPSTGQTETSYSYKRCWWCPVYRPDRNISLWQTLLMMSRLPAKQENLTLTNLIDDVPSTGQTGTSYSYKPCWWCPVYRPDRNILLLQTLLMMSRLPARQKHLTLTNVVDDVPSTGQTETSHSDKPCWWCPVYRPNRKILLWQTLLMMSRLPARQEHPTLTNLVDDVPSTGQTETSYSYKPCWWCPVYRPDRKILLWQTLLMMSRLPARQKHLTLTNLVDDVPSTGQTGTSYSYKPCRWCPVYRPDRNILLWQTLSMMSRLPARQEHLTLTNLVDDVPSTGQTETSYSYKPCWWCPVYRPDRNILLWQTLLMMSRLPARQKHLTLTNLVDDVPSIGQTETSYSDKPCWWCPVYRPDRNILLWQTLSMMSRLSATQKHLTLTNLVDDVPSTGHTETSYSDKPCWWCPVYRPDRNILLWQTLLMMSRLPATQKHLTLTNLVDDVPSIGQTETSYSYKPCWWCPVYQPGRNILLLQTLLMMSRLPARQEHLTLTNLVDDVPSTGQTGTSYSDKPCWWCPVYQPGRNILLLQTLLMMSRLPARQEHLTLTNLVDDVPSTGQTGTSYSDKPCWWCPVYQPGRNILLLQTLLMMSRLPARQEHAATNQQLPIRPCTKSLLSGPATKKRGLSQMSWRHEYKQQYCLWFCLK